VGPYAVAPFVGWLVAGSLKFVINSMRSGVPAWQQIGYGGMPSTHTTIVTTTAVLVGLREGWNTAAFAVAAALAFIVILDATSLRRQIGSHARVLNALHAGDPSYQAVRERIGHHWTEVAGGLLVGTACAFVLHALAQALMR
jgi:acid phosphatase family membrane protein YuiD